MLKNSLRFKVWLLLLGWLVLGAGCSLFKTNTVSLQLTLPQNKIAAGQPFIARLQSSADLYYQDSGQLTDSFWQIYQKRGQSDWILLSINCRVPSLAYLSCNGSQASQIPEGSGSCKGINQNYQINWSAQTCARQTTNCPLGSRVGSFSSLKYEQRPVGEYKIVIQYYTQPDCRDQVKTLEQTFNIISAP